MSQVCVNEAIDLLLAQQDGQFAAGEQAGRGPGAALVAVVVPVCVVAGEGWVCSCLQHCWTHAGACCYRVQSIVHEHNTPAAAYCASCAAHLTQNAWLVLIFGVVGSRCTLPAEIGRLRTLQGLSVTC